MVVCTGRNIYRRLGRYKIFPCYQYTNRDTVVSRIVIHPDYFNVITCPRLQKALHLSIGRNAVGVTLCAAACRCTAGIGRHNFFFLCQCLGILRQGGIFCGQLHIAVRHGKGGNFFGVIGQFQALGGLPGRKE